MMTDALEEYYRSIANGKIIKEWLSGNQSPMLREMSRDF